MKNYIGIDLDSAKELISKYGENIDKLTLLDDNTQKCRMFIDSLKDIVNENDEELLNEYNNIKERVSGEIINFLNMEADIKKAYSNEYNGKLFVVTENSEKINLPELNDDKMEVYDAGTDFSMIMTSIGAYCRNNPENFNKDWNRKQMVSQGFCTSYIRNDMIGTAPIPHCCYGFKEIREGELMLSGPKDMSSNANEFIAYARWNEKYCDPESQINETETHNELVLRRRNNEGEVKQPDYIVAFRRNGNIDNIEKIKQAYQDWKGKLPIVLVDVDKCIESERNKVEEMIDDYKENNDKELLIDIKQKIRNNSVTAVWFANHKIKKFLDNEKEKIEEIDEQKEDKPKQETVNSGVYENIYHEENVENIQNETNIIKNIAFEIQKIKKRKG